MHLHLEPVGGLAGDMFVAALLDAWPELAPGAIAATRAAGLDETVEIIHRSHDDGTFVGSRFDVHAPQPSTSGHHHHVHWSDLRARLRSSALSPRVRERTVAIFAELAEAEAGVHGLPVDEVAFHEVGAWDSIADITAAAYLIEELSPDSWSTTALPLGSGRVSTAHGELPVPAPATVRLLKDFICCDDGRPGERITPTGAAILRNISPVFGLGAAPRKLLRNGYGFGTRKLEGMSNILRVLAFEPFTSPLMDGDQIGVVQFEIDDQSGEDLALALDNLRDLESVVDVTQTPTMGKKGRVAVGVQLLVRPEALDSVIEACFRQTTTLGLRLALENRVVLRRREFMSGDGLRVKVAERPGGRSAKADIEDVLNRTGDHEARAHLRLTAEREILEKDEPND